MLTIISKDNDANEPKKMKKLKLLFRFLKRKIPERGGRGLIQRMILISKNWHHTDTIDILRSNHAQIKYCIINTHNLCLKESINLAS